jgi:hypothetical protein
MLLVTKAFRNGGRSREQHITLDIEEEGNIKFRKIGDLIY